MYGNATALVKDHSPGIVGKDSESISDKYPQTEKDDRLDSNLPFGPKPILSNAILLWIRR